MPAELSALEKRIGYGFRAPECLQQALTHRSYTQESPEAQPDNERLEFLGDAVLGLIVSERLIAAFPGYPEGRLTQLKASLVSAVNLVEVARRLQLGDYLYLGRGEELSGGRQKKALLVDALEALIAAIYLDGGAQAAAEFVDHSILSEEAIAAADHNLEAHNYKSALQELLQASKLAPPKYRVIDEAGPPHHRTFTIELRIGDAFLGQAEGSTKKEAEQEVARQALAQLRDRLEETSSTDRAQP